MAFIDPLVTGRDAGANQQALIRNLARARRAQQLAQQGLQDRATEEQRLRLAQLAPQPPGAEGIPPPITPESEAVARAQILQALQQAQQGGGGGAVGPAAGAPANQFGQQQAALAQARQLQQQQAAQAASPRGAGPNRANPRRPPQALSGVGGRPLPRQAAQRAQQRRRVRGAEMAGASGGVPQAQDRMQALRRQINQRVR